MNDARATVDDNPNLAALKNAYARWSETKGGNSDEILDLFAEQVEMKSVLTPDLPDPLARAHLSKASARDYFDTLSREWEMLDWRVDRYIADRDNIVMVGRAQWKHRQSGHQVDTPKVDIWHFEDGKVTSFLEMFDSLAFARAVGMA